MFSWFRFGCLFAVVIAALGGTGCIYHPAADTVLLIKSRDQAESHPIGFEEVYFRDQIIEGCGWHPREHESYAIVGGEPFPVRRERLLTVTPAENSRMTEAPGKKSLRIELCPELLLTNSDSHVTVRTINPEAFEVFEGDIYAIETNRFGKRILELEQQKLLRVGDPNDFVVITGRIVARPWPANKDPDWPRHGPQR